MAVYRRVTLLKRLKYYGATALCLLIFAAIATLSIANKSPAYDELFHVTGGYSYWITNDYRIQPSNGNLIQRLEALPLLFAGLRFPSLDQQSWWRPDFFGVALGQEFFYDLGNNPGTMLLWARSVVIVLAVALGVVIYRWSQRLFGHCGGLISLIAYCFCPTIIAHSQLATSDLAAALCFTLATAGIWSCLHNVTVARVLTSALACACLFAVKFSAPLLVPMAALMVLVRLLRPRSLTISLAARSWRIAGRLRQGLAFCTIAGVHAVVVLFVIWACYGFRYSAFAETKPGYDPFVPSWTQLVSDKTAATLAINIGRAYHLLPEAYLYGQAHTLKFEKRPAFLWGQCSVTGWWYYFPYCFAAKTPLAVFAMALMAAFTAGTRIWKQSDRAEKKAASVRRRRLVRGLYRTAPLWILLAVYWMAAIRSYINVGVRHILPTYPPLFILLGAAGWWFGRRAFKPQVICTLAVGYGLLEGIAAYPNYLAYFNQLVGGSRNGYKLLVDSNLDWGQDLPGLRKWLDANIPVSESRQGAYLIYNGVARPAYYGVHALPVRDYLASRLSSARPFPLTGGVYCVSATTLAFPGGRWTEDVEQRYHHLLGLLKTMADKQELSQSRDLEASLAYLEYARLLAFLRQRPPDDMVNYSILIFRLSDQEIQDAMTRPIHEAPCKD